MKLFLSNAPSTLPKQNKAKTKTKTKRNTYTPTPTPPTPTPTHTHTHTHTHKDTPEFKLRSRFTHQALVESWPNRKEHLLDLDKFSNTEIDHAQFHTVP